MQPRGQLWFALENVCQDFLNYSGLSKKDALETLTTVLTNMLAEQKADLASLTTGGVSSPADQPQRGDSQ